MTRLGMVPEVQFAEDFKQLRRDIEQIKNAQRIGRDILKPKIVELLDEDGNPTQYDLVTELDIFGGTRAQFTITFTADHQTEPWASPFLKLYYGNLNTPGNNTTVSASQFLNQSKTVEGKVAYNCVVSTKASPDPTLIYIKIYMYSTDTGTIETELTL